MNFCMQTDMDSYLMPSPLQTSSCQGSCSSVTVANSDDAKPSTSDMDTKSSKESVPGIHNYEKWAKEKVDNVNNSIMKEDEAPTLSEKMSKRNDSRKRTSEPADGCGGDMIESDDPPCKKCALLSGSSFTDDSIHMPESSGLTVSQLIDHVQTVKKKGLLAEYAQIQLESHAGTFNHSRARRNLPKNRYTDVLCYDHSRVKLAAGVSSSSDYINANFVDGYRQKNAYISTQGPLPKTFVDFWRMVWQYQCQVIVMTTRTIERQRMKCGQYWPGDKQADEQFEEFVIHNSSVTSFHNYLETKLILHNTSIGESREIKHLQFISWPDHGVPPAASFLDFLFHVRCVQEVTTKNLGTSWTGNPLGPPIVVHCSAGIGRTGTFITIDICLRRLDDIGTISIPATIQGIRSQRAFSIQTPDQYVFCYLGIIEHAIRTGLVRNMDPLVLDSCESDNE
ncbi:tyrosine-protein phosphatase non-receptor type 9-like [Babylonia areolata]|uniref:tyrosine-protein phosphatase non-receptor type 9-like n=1 Tax=Babylonia areolata TaxID=304850 RepID=UPI003FD158E2